MKLIMFLVRIGIPLGIIALILTHQGFESVLMRLWYFASAYVR